MLLCFDYYNFPVHYRIEKRKIGTTLIMSFRGIPTAEMIFEDTPQVISKDLQKGKTVDEIVRERIPDFLRKLFPTETNDLPLNRDYKTYSLPLAVIIHLAWEPMKKYRVWEKSSVEDYAKAYDKIITKWGSLPFPDAIPSRLVPEFEKLSISDHRLFSRALRFLFHNQILAGHWQADNPWDNHNAQVRSKKPTHKALVRKHILPNKLTKAQCHQIIDQCIEKIRNRHPKSGYWFAVLLLLTSGVSIPEVCALQFTDFRKLEHFSNTMVMAVFHHVKLYGRTWKRVHIPNPFAVRTLPVPTVVADAFDMLLSSTKRNSQTFSCELPIIPSPKNRFRRATPSELEDWINCNIAPQISQQSHSLLPGYKLPALSKRLIDTAKATLKSKTGYEKEEYLYHCGLHPQSTAAKHYADFGSEKVLNAMRCKLDRAIPTQNAPLSPRTAPTVVLRKKGDRCEWYPMEDQCTEIEVTIEIPPLDPSLIPDKELAFCCYSKSGGANYIFNYQK